jgi:pimeloyl-ACP methyl ester carboxylesterase
MIPRARSTILVRLSTSIRTLAPVVVILSAACGQSDPSGPDPSPNPIQTPAATVSGIVSAATGAVVEGATVTIGSATATTDADGRFELQNVPAGSASITTTAPRFDPRTESVSLAEGANTHDVELTPQTLFTYQNAVAYLPTGIAEYKVAIVFLPGLRDPATGLPLDSRGLVRGTSSGTCSIWCSGQERAAVRSGALGLSSGNVALIGTTTVLDDPAGYQTLLQALSDFGTQSLHPELANIPIFFVGHSMGGCTAYGFSRVHGARVAGFLTMKGGCHNPGPASAAAGVPGYFLIGALDEQYRRDNITGVFEAGRAAGAPWAISIDGFQHGPILDFDLMFDWIDAILAARLPLTPGAPLRAMTETDGWLGNRSTGAIATWTCYSSTRSSASWLPSQETALDWQRMAGGTVVVSGC